MPFFSVIIPVYNKEAYIEECINSVVNQSFTDIEIIIVDDGSTDNSAKVCEKCASKDERIRFISKSNTGVSDTRNFALKSAKGEYISFVDADDYIEIDTYAKCYEEVQHQKSDACYFGRRSVGVDPKTSPVVTIEKNMIYEKEQIASEFVKYFFGGLKGENTRKYITGSSCTAVYNKTIIEKNNICFPMLRQNEDSIFNLRFCFYARKISVIRDVLYNNRVLATSASRCYNPERLLSFKGSYLEKKKMVLQFTSCDDANDRVEYNFINMVCRCIMQEITYMNSNGFKGSYDKIMSYVSDEDVISVINNVDKNMFGTKRRIQLFMIKNKMVLFLILYYKMTEILLRK